MYDPSFSAASLNRLVYHADFRKFHATLDNSTKAAIVAQAESCALTSFGAGCSMVRVAIPGRKIYALKSLEHVLVARKIAANLAHSIRPELSSRDFLIGALRLLLEEGTRFNLYRLDLRKFYESFNINSVLAQVELLQGVGQRTKLLLNRLIAEHQRLGGTGVPAGLPMSSALSEMMMIPFDRAVRCSRDVYFYGRFVDDLILLTNGTETFEDFSSFLQSNLPAGTSFGDNPNKTKFIKFLEPDSTNRTKLSFEYLGYSFVIDAASKTQKSARNVVIDLSQNVLKRQKTRLARALLAHAKVPNFRLLEARLAFLTSNCRICDASTNIPKLVGVYHNHPHLSCQTGSVLHQLDSYVANLLSTPKSNRFGATSALSGHQIVELLRCSFVSGFSNRRYRHFSRKLLSQISECWKYEN